MPNLNYPTADNLKTANQIRNNGHVNNDYSSLMRSVQNINLNDNTNKNFNNIDPNISQNHYPPHENAYNSKYQHSHQSSQIHNYQYYSYQQMLQQRGQQQQSQQPVMSDNVFLNNNKNENNNSDLYQANAGYDDVLNKERLKRFNDVSLQNIWNQDNSSNDHLDSNSGQDPHTDNTGENSMENKFESIVKEREEMSELLSDLNSTNDQLQQKLLSRYFEILEKKSKKHPMLSNKTNLDKLKNYITKLSSKKHCLLSFDIEAFELNNKIITEIGISIYDPINQRNSIMPHITKIHIIIKEFLNKRNGKYVPDNKDNFLGGPSLLMTASDCKQFIQKLVDFYFIKLPETDKNLKNSIFIGHGPSEDLKWLNQMGIVLPDRDSEIFEIFDTQHVWSLSHGNHGNSLSRILRFLDIPHSYMHNAGNDCYFTLLLALAITDPQTRMLRKLDDWTGDSIEDILKKKEETQKKKQLKKQEKKDNANNLYNPNNNTSTNFNSNSFSSPEKKERRRKRNHGFDIIDNVSVGSSRQAWDQIFDSSLKSFN
ncbi:unnamed protein product [[Candida] boidinii]|uniref:Unnamed protein product n=1 Tax=Candida boidinii TaxID=5477 RepID=A0A9W6SVC1_CANBO|nr:hypothetical protein B5S30_g1739 [[Candida] boidinii]GME67403.1 unnamed protein product [[Candida] boidinii]